MSVAPEEPGVVRLPPHLLLAPNYATALKFVRTELGGPWARVGFLNDETALSAADVRAARRNYPESLFWIAEQYGDRLTGYDLAEAIKVWLTTNNAEDKSVCEVLKERGWRGIGKAEVFLSHVQAESASQTIMQAMRGIDTRSGPARKGTKHIGSKIWVDYFCLRQHKNDFQTKQVEQLIRKTGAVYVFMDGKKTGSSYPTRTFCVFELASAVENGAILMIRTPDSGPLQAPTCPCTCCTCTCSCCCGCCIWNRGGPLAPTICGCWPLCDCTCPPMPDYSINAANATARRADDKAKVDKYIEEGPGFAHVNQMMERELRRTAVKKSWAAPVCLGCCPCVCMGLYFDGCCPRSNPFDWCLQFMECNCES